MLYGNRDVMVKGDMLQGHRVTESPDDQDMSTMKPSLNFFALKSEYKILKASPASK